MRLRTRIVVAVLCGVLGGSIPAAAQTSAAERYDETFRKYSKRFFGVAFDWRLFKAQALVESNLDPTARSHAGARGIMQLMPATLREVRSKNPELRTTVNDIEHNIAAGIGHARQLWVLWEGDSDAAHLTHFVLASYNAGRGTLLRAQRAALDLGLNQRIWPSIEAAAPKVPRWRHTETLNYVSRVFNYLLRMDDRGRLRKP